VRKTKQAQDFFVIARSEATKQSILLRRPMDCFAALAMTIKSAGTKETP
jgi:hypothetical protein